MQVLVNINWVQTLEITFLHLSNKNHNAISAKYTISSVESTLFIHVAQNGPFTQIPLSNKSDMYLFIRDPKSNKAAYVLMAYDILQPQYS